MWDSQVRPEIQDTVFDFKKKSGIPKLSDFGLADVVLDGESLTVNAFSLIYDDITDCYYY